MQKRTAFGFWSVLGLCAALAACSQAAPSTQPFSPAGSGPALERVAAAPPVIGGCQVFPADNWWNTDISQYPVDPNSGNYLKAMNAATTNLHPDFGHNPTYGIPYAIVPKSQPFVPVSFVIKDQSDPGPYPIPSNAPIEAGGDHHVLVLDSGNCELYEMWHAKYVGPGWHAGSGAIFHLNSNKLRPNYWTSADAAGLPILPGLVRWDETQTGAITHALRFTVHETQRGFIHPATHFASTSTDPSLPPMGLRVRLKASYDISHFTGNAYTILQALKTYGMFVADNGSDWFISGSTDTRWNDNDLNQLKSVPASEFEVVKTGTIIH
ncbi:MAG TPA: hypothetical protein VGZ02_12215 [Candidatus Baltobacteraceae bacterium]|jgi:hypothetical protein|nr:hypothetical protein [Candidatus Baltobacteraceae bacterium]